MTAKVTQNQLIECYTWAMVRYGSYSDIRIDAVTLDPLGKILIYLDDALVFEGAPTDWVQESQKFA